MIVTIDGPAGSGKSTVARALATRLGFEFLNTGAMYRAVSYVLTTTGIHFEDDERVNAVLADFRLEMSSGHVILNGCDVTPLLRTAEMNSASSRIATRPNVRQFLVEQQRKIAIGRKMVCEGRDQGTVVFPDAACKFFLTATVAARAERRYQEMVGRGLDISREQVLAEQEERDRRDSSRETAPLRPAEDAILIDTSDMTAEQVLARLEEDCRRCLPG